MARPLEIGMQDSRSIALVVVDMQRDFMDGGALAVPGATQMLPVVNHYIDRFTAVGAPVFLTRDWHPADHHSFAAHGGPWPAHCIAESPGAGFASGLHVPPGAVVVSKGLRPGLEGFSAFEDTALASLLRERGVKQLWVCGVATETGVRATAMQALATGFAVTLLVDAVRAVDATPGAGDAAVEEIIAHGAHAHAWPRRRRASAGVAAPQPREQRS